MDSLRSELAETAGVQSGLDGAATAGSAALADGVGSTGSVEGEVREPGVEELRAEILQLQEALATREVIGQAKGIIRMLMHTDSDTAFQVLAKISQDTNRRLRDVAVLISDCAASSVPLPADVQVSWRARTGTLVADPPRATGPATR